MKRQNKRPDRASSAKDLSGRAADFRFYLLLMASFGGIFYLIIREGKSMEGRRGGIPAAPAVTAPVQNVFELFRGSLTHNIHNPLVILLLQIAVILLFTKSLAYFLHKIGQPSVIGEILAGIVLGPSILGYCWPSTEQLLFPANSLVNLQLLSQVGLMLFMFVIGAELDLGVVRRRVLAAIIISHASIIIPFTLGIGLAYLLYNEFAPRTITFLSFSLFIGISMSITAFPVLARIIKERGLSGSNLGIMALTCAAADDITAWCLLAIVIGIVKANSVAGALFTIVLSMAYVSVMLAFVRPLLKRMTVNKPDSHTIDKPTMGIVFLILILSAYIAEVIGIHALFGAFLAGTIMPQNSDFRARLVEKLENVSTILLLPLFFVFSGLRTQLQLLDQGNAWFISSWIIFLAVAGKFGGTALAARFVGQGLKESLAMGALMNTRGLMELIVLNIGYELGILSPIIFSMMVIMALVTTFMTCPVLDLINRLLPDVSAPEKIVQ